MNDLNQFAKTLANAVNIIHTGNGEVDNAVDLFMIDEDSGITSIKVNEDVQDDHNKVLAGKAYDSAEGDGSRALAIARLRNTKLNFIPDEEFEYDSQGIFIKDKTGGITIEGAYAKIVTNIGISKEHSDNMIANQEVLVGQLELRRESASGVSIDEEISNVIKFQKAYEANARVIAVLAEMLDVLINRTGV